MIHGTAIVSKNAQIGNGVEIGPYSIIEDDVVIGDGTKIGPYVVIKNARIGKNCNIYLGAVIGEDPQVSGWKNVSSCVVIGDNNTVREYVTVHRSFQEGKETRIGNNNFIMANAHIAHDCIIGDGVVITNFAGLTGHVVVEDRAVISGFVAIHQFVRIGRLSILGGASKVVQDVPPYFIADGHPASCVGINSIGLQRAGISTKIRQDIKNAYRLLYRSHLNTTQALIRIKEKIPASFEINHLVDFIKNSQRGIC
ncbi:TPA: acyl-[acyl-carrier-protein]--UDP-N-acetylglucosamine O-acyltransferase [bacterium]|nr:acyl-[acyl-carrier-protein]--UDP-N-acetylglucosamine O-acyltransferase [bacterium]